MSMIRNAVDDYASARCLLLNGFFPGLVLSQQAVEKFLKGSILFLDANTNTRKLNHGLMGLKNKLQELSGCSLDKFEPLIQRLEKHYKTRYPDNQDASTTMSTDELHEIDEFILFLNEILPVPNEVKFRSGLYIHVLDKQLNMFPTGIWLLKDNEALRRIYSRIHAEEQVIREKLE